MNTPTKAAGPQVARRALVSGRVQGVFYRASAQQRARAAGITGHAHNLADGRVEILAVGDERAVLDFLEWLWIGPSAAKVTNVEVEPVEIPASAAPQDFRTA